MRDDAELLDHILTHIDNGTTDLGDEDWYEPVENYSSQARFEAERRLMRRLPVPFCPVAALPDPGSYVARGSAGVPIVVVRDLDVRPAPVVPRRETQRSARVEVPVHETLQDPAAVGTAVHPGIPAPVPVA